jgi:hypothetical protein
MVSWFHFAGISMCLFALWAIARRDWVRLTTISRNVSGEVTGHRISRDSDGTSYAAILTFSAEGKTHEVTDQVLNANPTPPVGTKVNLTYPHGRPDLARIPRPLLWAMVYALLIGMILLLGASAAGWLPAPSGDIPG